MSTRKKISEINYKISDINELEIHIPSLSEELYENFDEDKLSFGFNFGYAWNTEENKFSVFLDIVFTYDPQELNENLLHFVGEVEYEILDLKKYLSKKQNEADFPEDFLAILTGIAISTMRGIVAIRTLGKFQNRFYLPIVNPVELVKDYLKALEGNELIS